MEGSRQNAIQQQPNQQPNQQQPNQQQPNHKRKREQTDIEKRTLDRAIDLEDRVFQLYGSYDITHTTVDKVLERQETLTHRDNHGNNVFKAGIAFEYKGTIVLSAGTTKVTGSAIGRCTGDILFKSTNIDRAMTEAVEKARLKALEKLINLGERRLKRKEENPMEANVVSVANLEDLEKDNEN